MYVGSGVYTTSMSKWTTTERNWNVINYTLWILLYLIGEKNVGVLISWRKNFDGKIFRHLETFSSLFPDQNFKFVTFPRQKCLLGYILGSLILRTRLKRKYFICSIEKHPWKRLQWKITIGILLSVEKKKDQGKILVGD